MTKENEQKISEALARLDQIDKTGEKIGAAEALEQLLLVEQEYKDMGMEHNILYRRGNALHGLERYDEAIVDLQKAIDLGGRDSNDLFILHCLHFLVRCYYQLSQWEKALDVLNEAESLLHLYKKAGSDRNLYEFVYVKSQVHLALGDNRQAIKELKKARKLAQDCVVSNQEMNELMYDLALAHNREGHPRRALKELREIDEKTFHERWIPTYLELKCGVLGRLRLNKELLQVADYFVSLGVESHLAVAWYFSGRGYFGLGNKKESESRFKKALEFPDPKGWVHDKSRNALSELADMRE